MLRTSEHADRSFHLTVVFASWRQPQKVCPDTELMGGTDWFWSVQQKTLTALFKQFTCKDIVSNTVTETNRYTEQFTKLERGGSLQT